MKISVAMTSYNAVKFIAAQLDTLRAQTLQPDEVIISDDCSTDGTYEFVQKYIDDYNLSGWRVYQNAKNLGAYGNTKKVLMQSTGKYIFPCDQDDEWLPDKIETMIAVMEAHPEIEVLASNYIPVVNGEVFRVNLKYLNNDDGSLLQLKLHDVWLEILRPGCTFCVRSDILGKFKVYDDDNSCYDSLLWKYAVLSDSLYLLNRRTMRYIRHYDENGYNATGAFLTSPANLASRIEGAEGAVNFHKKILSLSGGLEITPENQKLLHDRVKFFSRRGKVLMRKNVFSTALFVLFNLKYYPTFRNAMSDIYAVMFLR